MIKKPSRISRETILAYNDLYRVDYRKGSIRVISVDSEALIFRYSLYTRPYSFLSKTRLFERLLRLAPRLCISLSSSVFLLSCKGSLYRIDAEKKTIIRETDYPPGTNNPLYFCRFEEDGEQTIAYGEYGSNPERKAVKIFWRKKDCWSELFRFPEKTIMHIHNILNDAERNCLWIFTGDMDSESGIWQYDKRSGELQPFLVGSQQYRACYGFIEGDNLFFATDTPLQNNAIYKVDLNTREMVMEFDMPGPCIYGVSKMIKGERVHLFATSVEPDSSLPFFRYFHTYKLGAGVREHYSHIIIRYSDGRYSDIFRWRKDFFPMWLFQFGNCQFPDVPMSDGKILINPTALSHMDGGTFCLETD